jgi:hypothetical protein
MEETVQVTNHNAYPVLLEVVFRFAQTLPISSKCAGMSLSSGANSNRRCGATPP